MQIGEPVRIEEIEIPLPEPLPVIEEPEPVAEPEPDVASHSRSYQLRRLTLRP